MYQHEILKLILKLIENQNVKETKLMNQDKDFKDLKNLINQNQKESLYQKRCKCNEKVSITKKRKSVNRSEGRRFSYPSQSEITFKTFQIKYEKNLSSNAKLLLNSFKNKYLYYAIDDILYLLKSDPVEQENLLAILYSPVLSLQNDFCINFFDIWIYEIYITKVKKINKFLLASHQNFESGSYITIKFLYRTNIPVKKQESLW